eukprot:s5223_g1.t3
MASASSRNQTVTPTQLGPTQLGQVESRLIFVKAKDIRACHCVRSAAFAKALQHHAWAAHVRGRRRRAARLAFRALRQLRVRGRAGDPLMEAGLWHVLGISCGNLPRMLRRSLRTLKKAIAAGTMRAAPLRRMEAESLLRLRDYRAAFEAFAKVARFASEEDLHVAPFRLRHDVLLLERLVAAGRISADVGHAAVRQLDHALSSLVSEGCMQGQLWWARVTDLPIEVQMSLRSGLYDRLECVCPTPRQERLWEDKATCFRSLRPGYLGAFPWDGCVHPLLRCVAERLEDRLPRILHRRPLARSRLSAVDDKALLVEEKNILMSEKTLLQEEKTTIEMRMNQALKRAEDAEAAMTLEKNLEREKKEHEAEKNEHRATKARLKEAEKEVSCLKRQLNAAS